MVPPPSPRLSPFFCRGRSDRRRPQKPHRTAPHLIPRTAHTARQNTEEETHSQSWVYAQKEKKREGEGGRRKRTTTTTTTTRRRRGGTSKPVASERSHTHVKPSHPQTAWNGEKREGRKEQTESIGPRTARSLISACVASIERRNSRERKGNYSKGVHEGGGRGRGERGREACCPSVSMSVVPPSPAPRLYERWKAPNTRGSEQERKGKANPSASVVSACACVEARNALQEEEGRGRGGERE